MQRGCLYLIRQQTYRLGYAARGYFKSGKALKISNFS
jgi:hypothetical protein